MSVVLVAADRGLRLYCGGWPKFDLTLGLVLCRKGSMGDRVVLDDGQYGGFPKCGPSLVLVPCRKGQMGGRAVLDAGRALQGHVVLVACRASCST